eukprot:m.20346 g.20346  ORF g.20346 m.20346 type:complete len:75 (+) comp8155_c0_seq1:288-512(+)
MKFITTSVHSDASVPSSSCDWSRLETISGWASTHNLTWSGMTRTFAAGAGALAARWLPMVERGSVLRGANTAEF